ncbi:CCA-adding enzyme [Brevibacillus reuszeri]|uniref:CCA-adding enzyme n=1 Tax=Brevibacillus reuszeri TaxID=54915 RepID=A0A0K9YQX9_9BACL|nr:CCA tRNA nucleotidyltransferase [Brevibacillus reuszeri]KNB71047.1 tRNA CCA-adding enzyme [Brevibacillus reuszeri]MED1857465.1 CCA tRNA nucleotidyltransferase [Brevibacillus reuszeri]GED66705.1 CCA-adding enzyme [Brevibacillus reuszeri]
MVVELAKRVLETLEENGFEAYFVGGCVRDWLLNRPVHDIDICTNAHPGDVMRLFPDHVPTGLKHGTVSVKIEKQLFEVTTYRTEGKYEDYRRPVDVQFVAQLRLDLERRDFTINAMAMDRNGNLQDPFGGRADLKACLIRAVGTASERFQEDALRLLRGVRFAAQLGFSIEEETLSAMKDTAPLLSYIAVERVREELNKTISSSGVQLGCQLLTKTRLLAFSPGLDRMFDQSGEQVRRLTRLPTLVQKWSLLMYAAGFTHKEAKEVCGYLRMSNRETDMIVSFVRLLCLLGVEWDRPQEVDWGPLLLAEGWETCQALEELLQTCWSNERDTQSAQVLETVYEHMPVKKVKELAVSGLDLQIALQKKPGEWIMQVLNVLLVQTALHGLPNTPEALIEAAKKEVANHEH